MKPTTVPFNAISITSSDLPSIAPLWAIEFIARKNGVTDLSHIPGNKAWAFLTSIHQNLYSSFVTRRGDQWRTRPQRLKWFYSFALFLMEQSDLLLNHPDEERNRLRVELGKVYQQAKNYYTALDLYAQDCARGSKLAGETYVDKILTKLQKTGYLFNCANTMALMTSLFRINRKLQLEKVPQLIEIMLNGDLKLWQAEPLRSSLLDLFLLYIHTMEKGVGQMTSFSGRNLTPLKLLVQSLAIVCYLGPDNERQAADYHSKLYRYAALMPAINSTEKCEALLCNAFAVLVAPAGISYQWANIAQTDYLAILLSNDKRQTNAIKERWLYLTPTARLSLSADEFTLSPRYLVADEAESVLPKGLISWHKLSIKLGEKMAERITASTTDLRKLHLWWNELERHLLTREVKAEPMVNTRQRLHPQQNDRVQIVVDELLDLERLRYRCHIVGDIYEGYGTLDLADIVTFRLRNISAVEAMELFCNDEKVPYVFHATIKSELRDGSYQFRIPADMIEDKLRTKDECQYGFEPLCVVTVSNQKMVVAISEWGYSVVMPANSALKPGDYIYASLQDKGQNRAMQFDAEFVEIAPEGERFDHADSIYNLMSLYGEPYLEAEEEEAEEEEESEVVKSLDKASMRQLVTLVDDYSLLFEKVEKRYNYLSLAKLLSLLVGDDALVEQYELRLKGLRMLEQFSKNSSFDSESLKELSAINPEQLKRLPRLKRRVEEIQLLTKLNAPHETPNLMTLLSQASTPEMQRLISLVLAHNLLSDFDLSGQREAILKQIGELVGIKLHIESLHKLDCEEGEQVEFKTSVVYKANAEGRMMPDLDQQRWVILRVISSFINTRGGRLYLGVNDYSVINGLDNDLQWFRQHPAHNVTDMDDYQRYLTAAIAREWRNWMDLISVRVEGEGSHRYLVIDVRPGEPVMLDGKYWFRVGSECRDVADEVREGWLERRRATLRQMSQSQEQ